eukprot:10152727-Alexandrium_andersonii.AAC.1
MSRRSDCDPRTKAPIPEPCRKPKVKDWLKVIGALKSLKSLKHSFALKRVLREFMFATTRGP